MIKLTKTRPTDGIDQDRFLELVRQFPLRPIRNEREHDAAVAVLDKLVVQEDGTLPPAEQDYMEALTLLVADYQDKHHPIDTSDLTPLDMLQFLMDQQDMKPTDLGRIIGSRGLASDILHGKRDLSKANIIKLAQHFHCDPGLFIQMPKTRKRPKAA